MRRPTIELITPARAADNNGNWQTARRWARLLRGTVDCRLAQDWRDEPGRPPADGLIALHARRSAGAVARWREAHPGRPLGLVLTGTDLYKDLPAGEAAAWRSLALADGLLLLQPQALAMLPEAERAKADVCWQSTTPRRTLAKTGRHLRAVVVGHLRAEKAPELIFAAAEALADDPGLHIDHLGAALDPALGVQAQALAARCPRYRWLGARPHAEARARIQRAHLLIHPSHLEGGAHVLMEAVASGTPVLASRVDGNVGMLGEDWPGYFPAGDAAGLVAALRGLRAEPGRLLAWQARAEALAPRFLPAHEQTCLRNWLGRLGLAPAPGCGPAAQAA